VWVNGDDAYLGARSMARYLKVSLHKSGIWRVAWVINENLKSGEDRVIRKWKRPREFRRGWTEGPSVIVPPIMVEEPLDARGFLDAGLTADDLIWLPAPSPGRKVHFTVLLSKPWVSPQGWAAEGQADDRVVGALRLRSGEMVSVVWREVSLETHEREHFEEVAKGVRINFTGDPGRAYASVLELTQTIHGHPALVDILLGRGNLHFPSNE
jgi:hypothetical protein